MIKIADIFVSDDGCGNYALRLRGADAAYFTISNKQLYFRDDIGTSPRIYNATINLENLPNTATPITRSFSVDRRNCITITTTTAAPAITTTTVAPTITTTVAPATTPSAPTGTATAQGGRIGAGVYNAIFDTCNVGWVGWNPPASNGGTAITGYKITGNRGSITVGPQFRYINIGPFTWSGALNLSSYGGTITVQAINAVGEGPAATITGFFWRICSVA